MIARRSLVVLSLAAALGGSVAATAAQMAAFSQAAFDAARSAGGPVLVEVTAPWCPVCRAQKPILAELTADPRHKSLRVFTVDFDSQKDTVRAFQVPKQSTLIVFKGGQEVGRSTGDTNRASIAALLDKTL